MGKNNIDDKYLMENRTILGVKRTLLEKLQRLKSYWEDIWLARGNKLGTNEMDRLQKNGYIKTALRKYGLETLIFL